MVFTVTEYNFMSVIPEAFSFYHFHQSSIKVCFTRPNHILPVLNCHYESIQLQI